MAKKLISICITTFNESEKDINDLVVSLKKQSYRPFEIVIIDGKDYGNCSRSAGRNIAIKKAKGEIIAITDVGCVVDRNWLKEISKSFDDISVDVVAGGYKMVSKNTFNKSAGKFLGVDYENIGDGFLPSARSLAFRKKVWKSVGGFPEDMEGTAEDTVFNINLLKNGAKFKVNKKAFVYWNLNLNIITFFKKIYLYSLGDLKSGVWWHEQKKLKTHNIKALSVVIRHALFLYLLLSGTEYAFYLFFGLYILWSIKKAGIWGGVLQLVSDFAIIMSFIHYLIEMLFKMKDN